MDGQLMKLKAVQWRVFFIWCPVSAKRRFTNFGIKAAGLVSCVRSIAMAMSIIFNLGNSFFVMMRGSQSLWFVIIPMSLS